MKKIVSILAVSLFCLTDCDQSFNPKGPFESTLAVYGVLTTGSNTALVRVFKTYNPSGFDPYEWITDPSITDAVVSLFNEDTAFSVRDTILARTDTSRYHSDIKAYVAQPFPVEFGKRYSLIVNSPSVGSLSADVTIPSKAYMSIVNAYTLDNPGLHDKERVQIQIQISPFTRGYLLRGFLEYDHLESGLWITYRREVPMEWGSIDQWGGPLFPIYPVLKRRESSETSDGFENSYSNSFVVLAFATTASELHSKYGFSNIRINRAIFVLNQVEPNFYNYYNIVNAFRDKNSIRLDEPGYTNILGGEGVFGAYTVEEISHDLLPGVY